MSKNQIILIFLIIISSINYSFQEDIYNSSSYSSNNDSDKNSSSSHSSTFVLFMIIVVSFIILAGLFIIFSKITLKCCKKSDAFRILEEDLEKNTKIDGTTLYQVKYIYGLKYIFLFLYEKIFTSKIIFQNKNVSLGRCTICLNTFSDNENIFITACNHYFHIKCIKNYLKLIKEDIKKKEIDSENIIHYFLCPNCKSFLFIKKKITIKEIDIKNNEKDVNKIGNVNIELISNKKINYKKKHYQRKIFKMNNNCNIIENISTKNLPESTTKINKEPTIRLKSGIEISTSSSRELRSNLRIFTRKGNIK